MRRPRFPLAVPFLLVALAGCPQQPVDVPATPTPAPATPTPEPTPEPTPINDPRAALVPIETFPPMLDGGDLASLKKSLDQSLSWLRVQPPPRKLVFGPRTVTVRDLTEALEQFKVALKDDPPPEALAERVKSIFDVVESAGGVTGKVLFTGYYEPAIEASLTKRPGYEVPIYKRPNDFVEISLAEFGVEVEGRRKLVGRLEGNRVRPYWSREQITGEHPLAKRGLEIAWAKDPVDLFFVEIQGSGTLLLPDGKKKRIGYAGSNARPYRSIGSLLIGEGEIAPAQMSMQSLREWLAANPEERERVLGHNESYVFFRFLETGAVGSLGRPVTAERSIATDNSLFPPAALAFISTESPHAVAGTDGSMQIAWKPLDRFVLNQDTGGAIKGPGRVDVFWGQGPQATLSAGMMKQPGRLFFLVPKEKTETVSIP